MRYLKYSVSLFLFGWLIGFLLGFTGYSTPAFLSWKFSLLDIGAPALKIILNNLIAVLVTIFGPYLMGRFLGIQRSDFASMAFLYMIPTLVLFLNGFSAGYFTSTMLGRLAPSLIFLSLAPHGIFEIPAIILSGALSFGSIEELHSKGLVGKRYVPLILALILIGGYVEGNVTGNLPQIQNPVRITGIEAPANISAGTKFNITAAVENSGVISHAYSLTFYTPAGSKSKDVVLPQGRTELVEEMVFNGPGELTVTAVITENAKVLANYSFVVEVAAPNVSIAGIEVPELYAGEDAIIDINIENGDETEREVLLVFESTTGARNTSIVVVQAKTALAYKYYSSFGQPGEREFRISLLWHGYYVLSQKTVKAFVSDLRIKPKIASIKVPTLAVNKTSAISVGMENIGSLGGSTTLLVFDSNMPQLLRSSEVISIAIDRRHLGTGIVAEKEVYLEASERKTVEIEIVPREAGKSNLLFFALRREVIGDAAARETEVS